MRAITILVSALTVVGCQKVPAQTREGASPGGGTKATRTIEYDTDEGTYMCVDVSPDGKTLVFDLLGDLYTLPVSGGRAEPLLSGRAWDRCPRYSLDGKSVAFVSDRGNTNNLWVMQIGSRKLRQLTDLSPTTSSIGVSGTPIWHPNGREIAYLAGILDKKIFAVSAMGGKPRVLVGSGTGRSNLSPPTFMPDGQVLFSDKEVEAKSGGQDAKKIYRLSPGSDIEKPLKSVQGRLSGLGGKDGWYQGGDLMPVLSRTGKYLAYIHTTEPSVLELRVRDLKNGEDRELMELPDTGGVWSVESDFGGGGGYPGYAFTPNEKEIVIWRKGKLYRVSIVDGASRMIPFTVHVKREVPQTTRRQYRIPDGDLQVRSIRWPTVTSDGKNLIFTALGSLWTMSLPAGKPERLTQGDDFECMSVLSPDNKQLAYIAGGKEKDGFQRGKLMIRRMDTGATRAVTSATDPNAYWLPSWSPDGKKIALLQEGARGAAHYGWLDAVSGEFHPIVPALGMASVGRPALYVAPQNIIFSSDGTELLYVETQFPNSKYNYKLSLRSVRLDGGGGREILKSNADVTAIYPSPDKSNAVILGWDYEAYLTSLLDGQPVKEVSIFDLRKKSDITPVSSGGALYPRWLDDQTLTYGWTANIFKHRVGETAPQKLTRVGLTVPRRANKEVFALRNARIITIDGQHGAGQVIEKGTLLVRGNRIAALGSVENITIPSDAVTIDAAGLTITPGFIDAHSHGIVVNSRVGMPIIDKVDIDSVKNLSLGLSYGFTTVWDAASTMNDDTGLSVMELLEAGRLSGARWFSSTGFVNLLDLRAPASGVHYRSYGEVLNQVRHRVELGAEQCVKIKNEGEYRQVASWVGEAAREMGICAVAHVQPNPVQALSRVADGFQIDHPGLWAPSYNDVLDFMARSGSVWTTHYEMDGSGLTSSADHDDTELWRRTLWERLGSSRQREEEMFEYPLPFTSIPSAIMMPAENIKALGNARLAKNIVANGGKIAGGSQDGSQDFMSHFELWTFRHVGMPPGDVLRTVTMFPAQKLGLDKDIGSLEVGKLADLVILEGNPLEQIENTLKIKYTVLAGTIYERYPLKEVSAAKLASDKPVDGR